MAEKSSPMQLSDDELRVIYLALWTYVDSLEGEYDNDHTLMEKLMGRIHQQRRRMSVNRGRRG